MPSYQIATPLSVDLIVGDQVITLQPNPALHHVTATLAAGAIIENLRRLNGQLIDLGLGAAGVGTQRVAICSDSFALGDGVMNATTLRVALATDSDLVSLNQWGGQAINLGAGTGGTGTLRVIPDSASVIDNLVKMNGSDIEMNTGVRAAGTQRVTICTDDIVQVNSVASSVPIVCNEPVVTDNGGAFINADTWQDLTLPGATLVAGARYEIFVITSAPVMDQGVLYLQHDDAATLNGAADVWGKVITANTLYEFCPDAGIGDLTTLAIKRDPTTPVQYKVLINRIDT